MLGKTERKKRSGRNVLFRDILRPLEITKVDIGYICHVVQHIGFDVPSVFFALLGGIPFIETSPIVSQGRLLSAAKFDSLAPLVANTRTRASPSTLAARHCAHAGHFVLSVQRIRQTASIQFSISAAERAFQNGALEHRSLKNAMQCAVFSSRSQEKKICKC